TLNVIRQRVAAGETSVLFDDASLPAGALVLGATFTDDAGNASTAGPATVTVDNTTSAEFAITAPQNRALSANDVSLELTFTGATDLIDVSCQVVSIDADGMEATVGAAENWPDTSTPLSFNRTLAEGVYDLRVDCGGDPSQLIVVEVEDDDPSSPVLANESEDIAGRLMFDLAPLAAFVNGATADQSGSAGLQHDVRVLVDTRGYDTRGWTIRLTADPSSGDPVEYLQNVGTGPLATVDFTAVEFGSMDGTILFTALLTDALGRTSQASAELTIDRTPPTLVQVTPNPAQTLFTLDDDGNVSVEFVDLRYRFSADAAENGLEVSLTVIPAPGDLTPAGQSFTQAVSGGVANFDLIAFSDGTDFTSTAE
ncbi:MAG: hypothetical protein AAF658_21730, partial [Myxococcota bacterium]